MDISFKVQGGSVVTEIPRCEKALVDGLACCPTSILSDCLDRFNVLNSSLRPLIPVRSFAGPAFTVEEIEGGNLMSHLALKFVRPGDVLIIDGKGVTSRACWGGLQTVAAKNKGVAAVIIDGAIRDLDDIQARGVPVYCRAVTPAGPHKGWGGHVNKTISCAGMVVNPGDIVVADGDGVVVVPLLRAKETLERARAKMEVEKAWFERVDRGENTADFLGFTKTAADYGIAIDPAGQKQA